MKERSPANRGFSLLELLVAAAIVALAISIAAGFTVDSFRSMRAQDLTRHANSSKRDAILHLETSLRLLGWGIDPRFAIDMRYNCATTPCRDFTTSPDELVFVTRNPLYQWFDNGQGPCTTSGGCFSGTDYGFGNAWRIEAVDLVTKTLNIRLSAGQFLEYGRVVLAMCASGTNPVMLTLSRSYTGSGTDGGSVMTTLTPMPASATGYPYNDRKGLLACHGQTGAGMFLVDRYRYFISNQGTPSVPWLMLDTGMDLNNNNVLPPGAGGTDTDDLIPIAKNVEDMQVAYGLYGSQVASGCTLAPDANRDWILGNTPGTAEDPVIGASWVPPACPIYGTPTADSSRCTMHPANVRTIRVSLRLRSDMTDTSRGTGWAGDALDGGENRIAPLSGGQYRRYTAETSVTLRNLDSVTSFMF